MIFEIAGILGVDPMPFTLRELGWMIKARQKDVWDKVSNIMACALNANPFLKQQYKASDLNPFRQPNVGSADDVFDMMHKDGFIE